TIPDPSHAFSSYGTWTVSLTVTDGAGASHTATSSVTLAPPPEGGLPVSFRAAAASNLNSRVPSVAIPSSVAAGDVLLLFATIGLDSLTVTDPPGWSRLDAQTNAGATLQTLAWTRTATSNDAGALVRVTLSGTAKTALQVVAYRDASAVTASSVATFNTSSAARATPIVPVAVDGSMLVSYWADKSSASNGWTLPGAVTLRSQTIGTPAGLISAAVGDTAQVTAGSAGGYAATSTATPVNKTATWSIVVAPAQEPGEPQPPVAVIAPPACSAQTCHFDGVGSTTSAGSITSYIWAFGDGSTSSEPNPSHTYAAAGQYTVSLTVMNSAGLGATATQQLTVSDPPSAGTIAFRAAAATNSNSASPSVMVPASVQSGDTLVLFVTSGLDLAVTAPSGWTLLGTRLDAPDLRTSVLTRSATNASAGSSVQVGLSAVAKTDMSLLAYSGAGPTVSVVSAAETGSSATHASPAISVSTPGSWVVSYWADKSASNTGWTLPTGTTRRAGTASTGSGRIVTVTSDNGPIPTSTWPGLTATSNVVSGKAVSWTVVLNPA
ncbi:MAG: PKD domain-containing protein, partial [Rhodococcus sp.]|nr:PKD domain-containing protein [Rhodococcus sp. (in: high G+C Gram-positive bacteria)]